MTPLLAAYGIAVTLIGAWGTYAAVRRQRSGGIRTSEANDLWTESKAMRAELRAEAASCKAELAALREECRVERAEMRAEIENLRAQLGAR